MFGLIRIVPGQNLRPPTTKASEIKNMTVPRGTPPGVYRMSHRYDPTSEGDTRQLPVELLGYESARSYRCFPPGTSQAS